VHTGYMTSNVPVARVVKQGGVEVAPPPVSLRDRAAAAYEALGEGGKGFVVAVVGLWPITAVIAVGFAMCWAAMIS
jgi:hypothetical protein